MKHRVKVQALAVDAFEGDDNVFGLEISGLDTIEDEHGRPILNGLDADRRSKFLAHAAALAIREIGARNDAAKAELKAVREDLRAGARGIKALMSFCGRDGIKARIAPAWLAELYLAVEALEETAPSMVDVLLVAHGQDPKRGAGTKKNWTADAAVAVLASTHTDRESAAIQLGHLKHEREATGWSAEADTDAGRTARIQKRRQRQNVAKPARRTKSPP